MTSRPEGLPPELAALQRTVVMGVLNVTPDSFSDGGQYLDSSAAVQHGLRLREQGADIVDVGGESTRPGAARVSVDEECARVLPVVRGLVDRGVAVSIDTMQSDTARAAVDAGACLVNDVSGGLADPDMYGQVAALGVPYVAMHWRGHSDRMNELAVYDDVVDDVVRELKDRIRAAEDAGLDRSAIVIDPGLGFAKEPVHNWQLLHCLDRLTSLGQPVLLGASRKRFLGELLLDHGGQPRPVADRDAATDAITAIASMGGAWAVRVHDVSGSSDAVRVAAAWQGTAHA